jgi:hypothetical protein
MSLVNYVSPITYYLNESGIDWMTFTSDGRYMPLPARDIINPEKLSLGVRQGMVEVERMKSYEDQTTMVKHQIGLVYAAAEFQYLLDDFIPTSQYANMVEKTQKVALFFHQYDDKKRIKALTEVIDAFENEEIVVFGKWDREGPKFKGSVPFDELQYILPKVKYTFCYPIMKGDISGKWVEAVHNGIIPFFHDTYDQNRLLYENHKIPLWLWVKSPEEMKEKIQYLESKPEAYDKLRNILSGAVNQARYKNGEFFNNLINDSVEVMKNGKI